MELYLKNIDLATYSKAAKYAARYIVNNKIPIKIHYIDGTVDEGVYLKVADQYNYFVFNPERKTSAIVHKANVLKVETMGDLVQGFLEERSKIITAKIEKNNEKST